MDCSTCSLFLGCSDLRRGPGFSCKAYSAIDSASFVDIAMRAKTDGKRPERGWADDFLLDSDQPVDDDTPEDREKERKLQDLIDDAMSPQNVVPPDLKIDDRDLPEAPNFYTWCMGPNFLNYAPYPKQLIIGTHLLAEWCPACSSPMAHDIMKFPKDYPVEHAPELITFLEYGKCPKCGTGKAEMILDGTLNNYQEFAACVGQRAGKSIFLSLLQSYLLHCFLKLQNPGKVYNQARNTFFSATMVGISFARAKALLFTPLRAAMDDSPWFQEYHALLDHYSEQYSEDLYSVGRELINYRHRNLTLYPASPSKRALRGDTRAWFCVRGDTLVTTNRGLVRMDQVRKKDITYSSAENPTRIMKQWFTGKRKCVKVVLENGMELICTPDHRVLATDGDLRRRMVDAQDLEGMYVAVQRGYKWLAKEIYFDEYTPLDENNTAAERAIRKMWEMRTFRLVDIQDAIPDLADASPVTSRLRRRGMLDRKRAPDGFMDFWAVGPLDAALYAIRSSGKISMRRRATMYPKKSSYKLGYIVGALIADGAYNSDTEWMYGTTSESKKDLFIRYVKDVFGVELSYTESLSSKYKLYEKDFTIHLGVRGIRHFLRWMGLDPAVSHTKTLPWRILRTGKKCIRGMLAALIVHDGGLVSVYRRVRYSSKSPELLRQIQLVLWQFGFISQIGYNTTKEHLHIDDLSSKRFLAWVFKNDDLPDKYDHKDDESFYNYERGDRPCKWHRIPGIRTHNGMYVLEETVESLPAETLRRDTHAEATKWVRTNKWYWIPVRHVEKLRGKHPVYDLTVKDQRHAFTANGMIVHNSVDEIGWFPFGEDSSRLERAGAEEVYEALDRSLLTLRLAQEKLVKRGFNNILTALGLFASSPSATNDKIMSLVREFSGTNYGLAVHMASWQMSPDIERDSTPIMKAYKANPVKAERDYGANPPLADDAFIPEPHAYKHCFGKKLNYLGDYRYKTVVRSSERRYAEFRSLDTQDRPSILALDAGLNNNSFALAVGRLSKHNVPQIYGMMEISPEDSGLNLDFTEIFDSSIAPIVDRHNVAKVVVDRWQSTKIIQDVERFGDELREEIIGEQYSLRREDFNFVVDCMNDPETFPVFPALETGFNRVLRNDASNYPRCFRFKPTAHFLFQMATVTTTTKGVDKGQGYTDDLFRAVFLLLLYLYDEDEQYYLHSRARKRSQRGVVASRGYSNAGSGSTRSTSTSAVGTYSGRTVNDPARSIGRGVAASSMGLGRRNR